MDNRTRTAVIVSGLSCFVLVEALLADMPVVAGVAKVIASCGFRRVIRPYTWRARKRGITKHNVGMLADQALNAIFAFTRAPMRFCTLSGLIISAACILFSIISVVVYLLQPDQAPRGTTTIIVSLFFLSGIQMLFIGMLGEYITAIHNQVRGGPIVIEQEKINIDHDD